MRFVLNLTREADRRLAHWHSDKRAVLVNSRTAMNFAIVRPIIEAMRDDPRVRFYMTASEQPDKLREVYAEARGDDRLIHPRRAALKRFDAYLTADLLWPRLPRGTRRIMMFHGVAGKYANVYDSPDVSMRDWDRLFFINEQRLRNFIKSGAIDAGSPAARLVGYPKLDCLVDGTLNRDAILTSLGINPSRQTVLYAPTWSPYSSLNAMGEALVEKLCAAGFAVIVKLHDRSRDPEYIHSGGVNWAERLRPLLEASGGVLAEASDASPCLAAADVLITDHSSVGFEYLLLDRPLVRIEMPQLIAATNIHPDYVALMAEAATSVRDAGEAVRAVEDALASPADKSESRRAVASKLFYKPGTATARAVGELYGAIELEPLAIPSVVERPELSALKVE
ncbi:MAG TPA: CDP-glycerol glycerophosphotransferase family protein [Blastocatellia bacterium]|nr:CDP-glycerol glycerophosphotransferase family protein [Blastocatellia bacterium]